MLPQTISPQEVHNLATQSPAPDIIDVRTPVEYATVHVAGARSIPLDRLDPAALAASRAGRSDPLYVICQAGGRAAKACLLLEQAGLTTLNIEGGTAAWEKLGLPVIRSTRKTISLERQVRIAAGLLVLSGSLLAWLVHPWFLALPAFIGAGLTFAGITNTCGMGLILAKMPWNKTPSCT